MGSLLRQSASASPATGNNAPFPRLPLLTYKANRIATDYQDKMIRIVRENPDAPPAEQRPPSEPDPEPPSGNQPIWLFAVLGLLVVVGAVAVAAVLGAG